MLTIYHADGVCFNKIGSTIKKMYLQKARSYEQNTKITKRVKIPKKILLFHMESNLRPRFFVI